MKDSPLRLENLASLVAHRLNLSERILDVEPCRYPPHLDFCPQQIVYNGCVIRFSLEQDNNSRPYIATHLHIPTTIQNVLPRNEIERFLTMNPDRPRELPDRFRPTNKDMQKAYAAQIGTGRDVRYEIVGESPETTLAITVRYPLLGLQPTLADVSFDAFWSRLRTALYVIQQLSAR